MPANLAIYLRLSIDRFGTAAAIPRQRADCTRIAGQHYPDHTIVEYADRDESAYNPRAKRPAYNQMIADIAGGRVQAVVGWNMDRLLRQPRQLEDLMDLCTAHHVPVRTANGDLDLETDDGQLRARILVAVAKKSSDDTSRRVRRAAQDRAEQGRYHGGRYIPYGLHRVDGTITTDPVAVHVIQSVASRILAGEQLQSIARQLHALDPSTPRTREGWRQILTGNIVRGMNTAGYPAPWPAMLDPTTAQSLAVMLAPRSRARPNRDWPLSGYLICGVCSTKLRGHKGYPGHRVKSMRHGYYMCPACSKVAVGEAPIMLHVMAALDDTVIVVRRERDNSAADEQREIALEHLAAEYAGGNISRREWEAARSAMQPPVAKPLTREEVAVAGTLTLAQRLAHAVDYITVNPAARKGGRFDGERVDIRWLR